MRVRVYRNLRPKNVHLLPQGVRLAIDAGLPVYSVVDVASGQVARVTDAVALEGATFVVRPAGHARVLKEHRKNVHAFVVGNLMEVGDRAQIFKSMCVDAQAYYDPYKTDRFRTVGSGLAVLRAEVALLDGRGLWLHGEEVE